MVARSLVFPPGPPKSVVPFRQALTFRRHPLETLTSMARDYGDISYVRLGPHPVYLLNHPDYIKNVLVNHHENFLKGRGLERAKRFLGEGLLTSEKEFHRRQRRLSQPAFHKQRIAGYGDVMVAYTERLQAERWRDGETLDVWREMMQLTLAIVGKTLFDADVERDAEEIGQAVTSMVNLFNLMMMPFSELLDRFPLPAKRRFERARAQLDGVIYRLIDERRRQPSDRGDLLSMLTAAQDEDGDHGRMSDEQLRDEAMTIFLAGHETTANALTWTWYLLSQNPEAEARLHQEVDAVQKDGQSLTVTDLPRLRYTEQVFAEAMRLYPPAWTMGRRVINDYEVGGYVIPAGALVLLSQYVMHRDERYFPDPERFDPERWRAEEKEKRPPFSYFPFGGGPRRCIGEGFAWMEGVLLLATLARRWRLRLVPDHPVLKQALITLRPKHGMMMTLEKRSGAEH